MDPVEIIGRHYAPASKSHRILLEHGRLVAEKALTAAARVPHLAPDLAFVESAALLHDIGIFLTDSPSPRLPRPRALYPPRHPRPRDPGCARLPRHGLVCERHVGVGLSAEDIRRSGLPLPERDMRPVTVEEQIICYADKFFSKNGNDTPCEKSVAEIVASLRPYGADKVERFMGWVELFG